MNSSLTLWPNARLRKAKMMRSTGVRPHTSKAAWIRICDGPCRADEWFGRDATMAGGLFLRGRRGFLGSWFGMGRLPISRHLRGCR